MKLSTIYSQQSKPLLRRKEQRRKSLTVESIYLSSFLETPLLAGSPSGSGLFTMLQLFSGSKCIHSFINVILSIDYTTHKGITLGLIDEKVVLNILLFFRSP